MGHVTTRIEPWAELSLEATGIPTKFRQILEAFQHTKLDDASSAKDVCSARPNCKGQFRSVLECYDATNRCGLYDGGLAELIVNAMVHVPKPFMEWVQAA